MATHGQTLAWGTQAGRSAQGSQGHWLQRLRQWLRGRAIGAPVTSADSYHGWDSWRERFQRPDRESALEHAAARGSQAWFITLHGAAM